MRKSSLSKGSPGQDRLAAAFALHRSGDRLRAERDYRAVIKAQPARPDARYLLGMLYLEGGRNAEAAHLFHGAIGAATKAGLAVEPGWRLAHGSALQRLDDHQAALDAFDRALADDPDSIDALFCKATALSDLGRVDESIASYKAVLKRTPNHAEAANNLGAAYRETGRIQSAIRAFRAAVAMRPGYVDALCNLGAAAADNGAADNVVPILRAAARSSPGEIELQVTFCECLIQAGMVDEAERHARAASAAHPENSAIAAVLGRILQFQGKPDEARIVFHRAVTLDPGSSEAQQGLAELVGEAGRDKLVKGLEQRLRKRSNDRAGMTADKAGLWFALAGHYATLNRPGKEFDAYVAGNALKCEHLAKRGYRYNAEQMRRRVDARRAAFDSESFAGADTKNSAGPIFIVGMPRSGTSLTEQVLASHPTVFGAGELTTLGRISADFEEKFGFPGTMPPESAVQDAATSYLASFPEAAAGHDRVTDKMPGNFMNLGLIALMFPKAKIIHCRRDPIDTCVSCFGQNFRAATMAFTCDLDDLAHFYGQYRRMMAHWRAVLPPGTMIEVDYEDMIARFEDQARRIVDFAGLGWDDACLDFHKAERNVVTASHSQVRRPIYKSSVGRWRRYGERVTPLIHALGAHGVEIPDSVM